MGDLRDYRWIMAKGGLFLAAGATAAGLLLAENPGWRNAFLLSVAIWSCCRFYYFAFYVIEHYVERKLQVRRPMVLRTVPASPPTGFLSLTANPFKLA